MIVKLCPLFGSKSQAQAENSSKNMSNAEIMNNVSMW